MTALPDILDALRILATNPGLAALTSLLLLAAWIDWRSSRIPNWLTVTGMVFGLASSTLQGQGVWAGFQQGALGLLTGLCLFLPLYLIRAMGAGDVKLMAAVGAFLGPLQTVFSAFLVVLAGGAAAVLMAAFQGALGLLAANSLTLLHSLATGGGWRPTKTLGRFPFGLCICVGTVGFLLLREIKPF